MDPSHLLTNRLAMRYLRAPATKVVWCCVVQGVSNLQRKVAAADERRAKRRLSGSGVAPLLPALPLAGEGPHDGDVALIPEDPNSVRVRSAQNYQHCIVLGCRPPGWLTWHPRSDLPETQRGVLVTPNKTMQFCTKRGRRAPMHCGTTGQIGAHPLVSLHWKGF